MKSLESGWPWRQGGDRTRRVAFPGPTTSPRTNDFTASLLEDIQRIVRDDLQAVYTQLEAIAGAVRQLSTAGGNPDELMTVGQVAEIAKVAASTVRMWIHSGKLRASRPGIGRGPGRTFRISRADLREFVASVEERFSEREVDTLKWR